MVNGNIILYNRSPTRDFGLSCGKHLPNQLKTAASLGSIYSIKLNLISWLYIVLKEPTFVYRLDTMAA